MIQSQSGSSWEEMYKVFNMGNLLEFYTDPKTAEELISIAHSFNIEAQVIGRVEAAQQKTLSISTENGQFTY
jgi:phosphoribosylformylglycinamidine cyclo-ligase